MKFNAKPQQQRARLHLAQAVETGWITRERRGVGLYNRGYTYQATVPPEVEL